uniref:Uncharacterized protein n=1 Tax=Romanomermis culicivorax TaxID=13658 RepID=A0A915KY50_ROMCU
LVVQHAFWIPFCLPLRVFISVLVFLRVVVKDQGKLIEGITFEGWMSHYPNYTCSYLNVAVAIGLES